MFQPGGHPASISQYDIDANIHVKNIVLRIHFDAKNVHALISILISHVSLVMELGKIMKYYMKWFKIAKCLKKQ